MTSLETLEVPVCDWRKWKGAEQVALYQQESSIAFSKMDKKAINLIREMSDTHYRHQTLFHGKKSIARHKLKTQTALDTLIGMLEPTAQETLYSSDTSFGSLLGSLQKGDEIVIPKESKSFVNPNKAITGIRYTHNVAVLHGVTDAFPVPFRLSSIDTMYLIPAGTEFTVDDVVQETWKCQPLISCPNEYRNISVYHLRTKN